MAPLWRHPLAWILFYLVAMDVGASVFFAYPADPKVSPTKVQRYFEYGRSAEGKLAYMTRRDQADSAPIVAAGWLVGKGAGAAGPPGRPGRPVVTVFGMSHAHLLARDLAQVDPALEVRTHSAPQAVPTWTYAAYLRDRERRRSDVVVLSFMTDTVALLTATAGTTMYFEGAYPYTWPRYFLEGAKLRSLDPPFLSAEEYRRHFFDPEAWRRYVLWLEQHDPYYDPLLFRATLLDRSSLFRLLRRSYGTATRRSRRERAYDPARGFDRGSEVARLLEAVVAEFARQAHADDSIPMVYLVNNLNRGDHLFALLRPVLEREAVACLSSHEICPPSDQGCYQPDSHFVPEKDREMAEAMSRIVHARLAARAGAAR